MANQSASLRLGVIRIGFILGIVMAACAARAQDVVVDCSGQDSNAYHSINDALANLPFVPWQVVMQVTGTCNESIYLGHLHNLMIAAPLGQTATIQGDGVSFGTLNVDSSTGIYLYGLTITGSGSVGLNVNGGAEVRIDTCTFQNNPGDGIAVADNSSVLIYSALSTGNSRGISISANSTVDHASWAGGSVVLSSNANAGLYLSGGRYATGGNTLIQNNGFGASTLPDGFGTDVRGAGQIQFGNYAGPNLITGNRSGGVSLQENAEVSFWGGTNTIQNNGATGIVDRFGSQVTLFGNVEISGHTAAGLDIASRSQAYLDASVAPNNIHNNGFGPGGVRAGIRVDGSSQLVLTGPNQITQNGGPGVLGDINSSMDLSGSTISGNQSDGIRALHQTVVDLGPGMSLTGNGGAPITCDNTSMLVTAGKASAHCLNVQASESGSHEAVGLTSIPSVPNFTSKMKEYKRERSLIPRPRR
jgi:hypothetical protein